MTELITRLESADGPSRELFEAAFDAAFPMPRLEDEPEWAGPGTLREPLYHAWYVRKESFQEKLDAEAWTSAAEMLVPEGCLSMVRTVWADAHAPTERPVGYASVDRYFKDDAGLFWKENFLALGETPALALAAAALKARGV